MSVCVLPGEVWRGAALLLCWDFAVHICLLVWLVVRLTFPYQAPDPSDTDGRVSKFKILTWNRTKGENKSTDL